MSLNFAIEESKPAVPPGTYRAKLVKVEETEEPHPQYGDGIVFGFRVSSGELAGEEVSRTTGTKPTAKSALGKMLASLAGCKLEVGQRVDIDSCIGKEYLINVTETDSGWTRVENAIAADV